MLLLLASEDSALLLHVQVGSTKVRFRSQGIPWPQWLRELLYNVHIEKQKDMRIARIALVETGSLCDEYVVKVCKASQPSVNVSATAISKPMLGGVMSLHNKRCRMFYPSSGCDCR
eukprot:5826349-Amphidinium_carterae.1